MRVKIKLFDDKSIFVDRNNYEISIEDKYLSIYGRKFKYLSLNNCDILFPLQLKELGEEKLQLFINRLILNINTKKEVNINDLYLSFGDEQNEKIMASSCNC